MQNPLLYLPPSLDFLPRKMVFSTWVDHIPFGYDLVAALRPQTLVELGTHNGMSFYVFCQAMVEQKVDGTCYAVDSWEGDDHTGAYGEDIFNQVQEHTREYYRGVSYLLRMLFAEAAKQFADDSIDILHIDGLHTYEAVREDFETWYPRVRPGGIILFHDVEARIKDFGAWKYWAELEQTHRTFKFHHGFGLGVLQKPGGAGNPAPLLQLMFDGDRETRDALRRFYVHLGRYNELERKARRAAERRAAKDGAGAG
jgi:predicted O-methyltransferase YrrM